MEFFKLDLHTHSSTSYDGGITSLEYRNFLETNKDFCLAVTDHNEVSFGLELLKDYPNRVIAGEEVLTSAGEVIGLFLEKRVEQGLGLKDTILQIKAQGGLVYIPHPFEKTRKGVSLSELLSVSEYVDVVESYNGRSKEPWKQRFVENKLSGFLGAFASSSDAHGIRGLGRTYTQIFTMPSKEHLVHSLREGRLVKQRPAALSFFDPMKNKLKKLF